ncbi:T9SS type A sorting domain-containing protein [Pontibacter sp. G13]|uniref:T9SS type A sorting domain-containing protein n=1 Tax=Pontibacter sp. G13 TaxID=3074898 RepID=UPI00288C05B7|nr:T9SS type A sorting domain-containing protein [Pontibacter sp. G13]WNJ19676.1 T9SS type A sorting domain-containing protein [Pontibacter sp. G13]
MKHLSSTLMGILCLALIIGSLFSLPDSPPLPTDRAFGHSESQDRKAQRKAWIEQLHRAAPQVDWKQQDAANRIRIAKTRMAQAIQNRTLGDTFATATYANNSLTAHWRELGSLNQSGRIHLGHYDSTEHVLYLASSGGNIWKGDLQGSNWEVKNDLFQLKGIQFLHKFDLGNGSKRLVAGTTDWNLNPVWYSDDDGTTWTPATGLDAINSWGKGSRFVLHEGRIWMTGRAWKASINQSVMQIYFSDDQGESFQLDDEFVASEGDIDLWADEFRTGPLYMIKDATCWKKNIGAGWQSVGTVDISRPSGAAYLMGRVSDTDTVLYAHYESGSTTTFYRSDDAGQTWQATGVASTGMFFRTSASVSAKDPYTLYVGGVNAYRSTDSAQNFTLVNEWYDYYGSEVDNLHADIPGFHPFIDSSGQEITVISTDGGAYLSYDQLQTVTNISLDGLNVGQYYSSYTHQTEPEYTYVGAQDQGFQRSSVDNGRTVGFTQTISGDYGHLGSGDGGETVWANYPGFTIYFPFAKNSTTSRTEDFNTSGHLWLAPLEVDPGLATRAYLGGGAKTGNGAHLIQLTANAFGMTSLQLSYDFSQGTNSTISAIGISKRDPNERYVLTDESQFYSSLDAGATWTPRSISNLPGIQYFYGNDILPSPTTAGRVYVAGSGYSTAPVWVSQDYGATFQSMSSGLPNTLVYGLATTPDERYLFAATELGPYLYSPDDQQWYPISGTAAPDQTYWAVEYVEALNTARFVTYGRGIWDFVMCDSFALAPTGMFGFQQVGDSTQWSFFNQMDGAFGTEWYVDDSLVAVGDSMEYTFTEAKTYEVKLVGYNHCTSSEAVFPFNFGPPVSVEPTQEKYAISLYPNPASEFLHIEWEQSQPHQGTVELYNLQGQRIAWMASPAQTTHAVRLPVDHLAAGSYRVRIVAGESQQWESVVIR